MLSWKIMRSFLYNDQKFCRLTFLKVGCKTHKYLWYLCPCQSSYNSIVVIDIVILVKSSRRVRVVNYKVAETSWKKHQHFWKLLSVWLSLFWLVVTNDYSSTILSTKNKRSTSSAQNCLPTSLKFSKGKTPKRNREKG